MAQTRESKLFYEIRINIKIDTFSTDKVSTDFIVRMRETHWSRPL